tara:strand:- start:534 stop:848 length:315 start_codon:yes stop_codon:yes gene_type:complete
MSGEMFNQVLQDIITIQKINREKLQENQQLLTPKNQGILVHDYNSKGGYQSARGNGYFSPNRVQFNSNMKTRVSSRSRSPNNMMLSSKYSSSNTKKSYDRNRFD